MSPCHLRPKLGMNQSMWLHQAAVARRMRIAFFIAVGVMLAMVGNPNDGGTFAGEAAEERDEPFDRPVGLKTAVGEQAMIAQANADAAGEPVQTEEQADGFPGEEERSGEAAGMHNAKPNDGAPIETAFQGSAGLQRLVGPTLRLRLCGFADASFDLWREHGCRHGQSFLWKVEFGSNKIEIVVPLQLDQRHRLAVTSIVGILEIGPGQCVRHAHGVCKNHVKIGWVAHKPRKMRFNLCGSKICESRFNEMQR